MNFDNTLSILKKVCVNKVFVAFSLIFNLCLLCIGVDYFQYAQIYSLVIYEPRSVDGLYNNSAFAWHDKTNEELKHYENTISYRIYLIKKLKKDHFGYCPHCRGNGYLKDVDYDTN